MIGILSVGGHVPRYRLSGKALGAVWGGGGAGERAVANYDEDSLTMSCEAALSALHGRDLKGIGRFYGQLTDCDPATVGFEMPVELCFRRIHEGEGFISYFWKFRPA